MSTLRRFHNAGDAGHHPQRRGQLFQLQPGPQQGDRVVGARLAGNLLDLDFASRSGYLAFDLLARLAIGVDVVLDPAVQPVLGSPPPP